MFRRFLKFYKKKLAYAIALDLKSIKMPSESMQHILKSNKNKIKYCFELKTLCYELRMTENIDVHISNIDISNMDI